jgi:PAS domain S-box-containing protein
MVKQRRGLPLSFYIVAFALALAIPAVIFAGAVTYRWVRAEQAHLEGTIDQLDDELVSSIDRFVAGQIAMLQALATSPALDTGELHLFDEQARALVRLQGIHIVMRDMAGQQVINTRLPWRAALPKAMLDADRVVIQTKQTYVSDLIIGAVTRTPLVVVNVPVVRDGAVRYVLNASVPPQAIAAVVESTGIKAPYSASVVDRKGLIIARSEMSTDFLGKPHPAFGEVTGPRGIWTGVNPQQIPVLGHYRRSALSGWFVSVGVEKAALEAPLTRSLWWLGGLGVLLGGLALALAVLVGRRIVRAQSELAAAARAVGLGETIAPPQTAVREGNRIGEELAQASVRLSEQAAALVEANRLLEFKIEERTRDLAASEAQARLLSENVSDVITLKNTSLRRSYASPASSDVLGYSPDELLGGTPIDIVHPEDAQGLKSKLEALARGEIDRARSVHRFRHKRGSWIWVEVNFRLVRAEDGAPQDVVSVIRDISERRQLEEHLRESQKMEAVGQLTSGIAHEFNNLLMVVLGNAEVLAEEVRDPELQKLALAIQGSAERGSDLTQKLLAFGRRQSLRPERLDLSRVVSDMVPLLRHALGRGVEIVTEGPAEPVFALADPNPSPEFDPESRLQRARRHAQRRNRRAADGRASGGPERRGPPLRPARGVRHRLGCGRWHSPGCAGARVRALLHHEGGGQGHGAWPLHGLRLHPAIGRARHD